MTANMPKRKRSAARTNPGDKTVLDFLGSSLKGVYRSYDELPDEPDEFPLSRFSTVEKYEADRVKRDPQKHVLISDYLIFSDYSGSDVERSNARVFFEQHGDKPGIYRVYGGYGTDGIAIRLDVSDDGILEDLARLEDYPVLDENDLSKVSNLLADEAAESYGFDDFVEEVEKRLGVSIEYNSTSPGKLADLFWELTGELAEPYIIESGGSVVFFPEKMAKLVDLDRLRDAGIEYESDED